MTRSCQRMTTTGHGRAPSRRQGARSRKNRREPPEGRRWPCRTACSSHAPTARPCPTLPAPPRRTCPHTPRSRLASLCRNSAMSPPRARAIMSWTLTTRRRWWPRPQRHPWPPPRPTSSSHTPLAATRAPRWVRSQPIRTRAPVSLRSRSPPQPPAVPPLSPPPQHTPQLPAVPQLRQPSMSEQSVPSSSLLFTPRLPAADDADAEAPAKVQPPLSTPGPAQLRPITACPAAMAAGEDSDSTPEARDPLAASAGASSRDSAAPISDSDDSMHGEPQLFLGGLVSAAIGSDSSICNSLRMMSSPNPTDPAEHLDAPSASGAQHSNSYPVIHPSGGPTTDLSLPQPSSLLSFDSAEDDGPPQTLDSRVALAVQAKAHATGNVPDVWRQISSAKVQLSEPSGSFLQDTMPDSVLDTLPESRRRNAGDSLIEETAAMPVAAAVAGWPPDAPHAGAVTVPLRPHSAQPSVPHSHSMPRELAASDMRSPFQPARSYPNLQRFACGAPTPPSGWAPDSRTIQEIISTTTFQPTVPSPDSSSRIHSSPINHVTLLRGSSPQPPRPASLHFTPSVRISPPISSPPRPVSPKSTTSPHLCTGALHFPSPDTGEASLNGHRTSPGVSGVLSAAAAHHRSSPLPPLQPTFGSHATLSRRRVSSPGGAHGLLLPPPPVWLKDRPTNAAYPRLAPQSAPVMQQQQHFDCGDLPEELAPSTLLDTWPPHAPPAEKVESGDGASDADDERDSDGSDTSTDRSDSDSLDAALAESCVLPWGLPAALQPGSSAAHASGALRSPAEAAGQAWEGVAPDSPTPPQSLSLPPIREESMGTEHLEYLYQSDYASTPAASAMHTLMELPAKHSAACDAPPAVAPAAPPAEAAEHLDVSVSIAAAIPPVGGTSSARAAEAERRLSGDIGRSALSASGSISDGDMATSAPLEPPPGQPYAALYGSTSSIVLQPRNGQQLTSGEAPSSGKGMFRFRKFLDVARVKNPAAPTSTSGPLPSPGGSSASSVFPTSVRSRTACPSPRDTRTLDPASTGPLGPHSAGLPTHRGAPSAAGIPFLQESTSAPTLIGLSHFSNAPLTPADAVPWPPRRATSRASVDTASSAPLRSQNNTPRLEPPSSFGTTASGYPALPVPNSGGSLYSGPLADMPVRAPVSMPSERPSRVLHMLQAAPPPPSALALANPSGSDADDEQETARTARSVTVAPTLDAAAAAAAAASAAPAGLAPSGGASMTSVDTGNSTLLSRVDSQPPLFALRTLTAGSAQLPTIDSDPDEEQFESPVPFAPSAAAADVPADVTQPGGSRGNPCEPATPPMVIVDSSAATASTASTTHSMHAVVSAGSHPHSHSSGPTAGRSSSFDAEVAEHSQRTLRSEASVSTAVTSSSWASVYPRYIFHPSMMQLTWRRDQPGRDSDDPASAVASMLSAQHVLPFPGRALSSRRSSLAPGDGAARQRSSNGADRQLPRLPLWRPSGPHAGMPPDSIARSSELSGDGVGEDSAEVFMDARSVFASTCPAPSSLSTSRDLSIAAHLESREAPPLERTTSALEAVNTAGTATTGGGISNASHLCIADSALGVRLAELRLIATQPSLEAPTATAAASATHNAAATSAAANTDSLPVATITHSLLGISSDGLSSRPQSENGAAASAVDPLLAKVAAAGASHMSEEAGSPMLSPSGRYVPGKPAPRQRSENLIDADVEGRELPGHDGLEVLQRRCPGKSLVTGAWPQGHVSWFVDAWDICDAVLVTHPKTVPRRVVRPRLPPPNVPVGHDPAASGISARPLLPLTRRLSTHHEESGGSMLPLQSVLGWDDSTDSTAFESMIQMASLRPELDADARTHSVQLTAQEPLPPGWTTAVGQTVPMLRSVQEARSSDVDTPPGVTWMYQSLPASMHAEPGHTGATQPAQAAERRGAYGTLQPRSVGNQYTSVLRSALLPRSLGWGTAARRGDAAGRAPSSGRPPRPRTGPSAAAGSASSSPSILKRCKRALSRASGRKSKPAPAKAPQHAQHVDGDGSSCAASLMSSTQHVSAAVMPAAPTPVSQATGYESDAEVQVLPPMDTMPEDGEAASHAAPPPGTGHRRRWLAWRWKR
eukprot:jgi/Ulvmu1/12111/UM084_0036.1